MEYEQTIKNLQTQHNSYWIWIGHILPHDRCAKESMRRDIQKTLLIKDNVTCKYRKEGNVIKQYIHIA